MDVYYLDGIYFEENHAKISVLDLGLVRGFGVFDYLRTYNRRPFHLQEHLERLKFSAEQLNLTLHCSFEELVEIVDRLISMSTHEELSIKILITGGVSSDQIMPEKSSLIVFAYKLKTPPGHFYSEGITAVTTSLIRTLPMSKSTNYIPAILALQAGKSIEAQEALYLNQKGEILEGTTSNFFAIKGNKLMTPHSEELLLGITRAIVLELAKKDFEILEIPLSYESVGNFDECFVTSSSREIIPLVKINHQIIKTGKPGPHTKELQRRFSEYTKQQSFLRLNIARYNHRKISSENPFPFAMTSNNLF